MQSVRERVVFWCKPRFYNFFRFFFFFLSPHPQPTPKLTMSWQAYVDSSLMAGGALSQACMIGRQDAQVWGQTPDFGVRLVFCVSFCLGLPLLLACQPAALLQAFCCRAG